MTNAPAPSLHYVNTDTGEVSVHIPDLVPAIFSRHRTRALEYVAENVHTAWCWQCHDTGILGTSWGPSEGCREYMTAPEVWYCTCEAGHQAKLHEDANGYT